MTDSVSRGWAGGGVTEGSLLNRMTNRIRRSLELQEILTATVAEVRSFLGTDRVKIYRFQPDGSGQVIAESIHNNRLPSLLGLYFPAGDIPPSAREMFVKARQRTIVDVPNQTTTLSRLDSVPTTADLTLEEVHALPLEDILQRPVDPCHVQYLTSMGVQSSLVIPILHQQELWGLLVSHHASAQQLQEEKIQIVQLVADQVSIAIAQSELLTRTRERARREAVVNHISTLLHSPLPIQQIMHSVLEKIVTVVGGSAGRLYLFPRQDETNAQLFTVGRQPDLPPSTEGLEITPLWQRSMVQMETEPAALIQDWDNFVLEPELLPLRGRLQAEPLVIPDIYQEPQLEELYPWFRPTPLRSLMVMPLRYGDLPLGFLTLFRDEMDTSIVWAGKFDPDDRNQRVRESFQAWCEIKHGQVRKWLPEETELVRSLGIHLIMAVMQIRLYEWEREQRLLVEMRNQELHTARTVAEEASKLKSDFLSSTSHELRTPLASTLNYLKLLKEGFYDNPEELQEYINVAHASAESLVAIINDVLDIAKIEAGRMQVQWEWVNLPALLHQQEDLFRLESCQKGIALSVDCEVERVWADGLKLRQIFTNLLANAFKFTTAGEVRIRVIRRLTENSQRAVVEASVTDTGIGIASSQSESLFEPFVQADGSIKRRYGGTGLGLTVCKQLVELMGGQIWLVSLGEGQGTTVTFTLPDRVEGASDVEHPAG